MAIKYDPFVGLTYDGIHSSVLGLYRVSDGSRYNENLLPSFSDKTTERTGADGMYFFGSNHQQKDWSIEFAFDHITKEQLRDIKQWLGKGSKKPLKLVFDEDRDYEIASTTEKISLIHNHNLGTVMDNINDVDETEPPILKYYMAKVAQVPQIKTLCFEEKDENGNLIDVYKGELTVEFVSYTPFGYGKLKYFKTSNSFIPSSDGFNEGDIEVYPLVIIYKESNDEESIINFSISGNHDIVSTDGSEYFTRFLGIQNVPIPIGNYGIVLDFEKGIISGLKNDFFNSEDIDKENNIVYELTKELSYIIDNKIYNGYISEGDFFEIPLDSVNWDEEYSINLEVINSDSNFKTIMCIQEKLY